MGARSGAAARAAAAICSTGVVAAMLTTSTTPAPAAARAVASSPSGWASRWNAVGEMTTGSSVSRPNRVVAVVRVPLPRNTLGSSASLAKPARLARNVVSSPAPPAKKS